MQAERDLENSPPSSSLKPILVVGGALAGLMLLVCGGVAGYVAMKTPAPIKENVGAAADRRYEPEEAEKMMKKWYAKNQRTIALTEDPVIVTKIAATIFKIDLPADFSPREAEQQGSHARAVFSKQSDNSALLKMARAEWMMPDATALSAPDDPQARHALEIVESDSGGRSETTLRATRQEIKTFQRELTVLGQQANFTFKQGKRALDNKPVWKIWGAFGTTNGAAAMIMLIPASEFDEQAVVRMIEGIHQADKLPTNTDDAAKPD